MEEVVAPPGDQAYEAIVFPAEAVAFAVMVEEVLEQVMSAPTVQLTEGGVVFCARVVEPLAVQPLPLWVTVTE